MPKWGAKSAAGPLPLSFYGDDGTGPKIPSKWAADLTSKRLWQDESPLTWPSESSSMAQDDVRRRGNHLRENLTEHSIFGEKVRLLPNIIHGSQNVALIAVSSGRGEGTEEFFCGRG